MGGVFDHDYVPFSWYVDNWNSIVVVVSAD